jgi:hypothetical protein
LTLSALIAYCIHHTGATEPDIRATIAANWPHTLNFTSTQARLLADLIRRKQEKNGREPKD